MHEVQAASGVARALGSRACLHWVGRAGAGATKRRRRWCARACANTGERVGEVARRYGVSRCQLSAWRGLARKGKLALASSTGPEAEPMAVSSEPEREPAFATLEVDAAPEPDRGSVSIEARGVTVRLDGNIGAGRIAEIASMLRALR